jgi:D-3-phosphoglycerate dehydrogenase
MSAGARVLVTPRSAPGHPALQRLEAAGYEVVIPAPGRVPTRDEQLRALADAVGYVAGVERIGGDLLRAAPRLRVISRNGVGTDGIDGSAAEELGIAILRAPAANAQGVAELALALMLSAARGIPAMSNAMADGRWDRHQGIELAGRTLGVVGCGQIGRRVSRAALALGMHVVGYDAFPDPDFAAEGFRFASWDDVVEGADVLTLHAPPADRPLVDAVALARMREGAIIVNTARAGLVDEPAIVAALDSGRLHVYAADAFDPEPPGSTPLTRHPRFIGTPHVGGYTAESVDRAMAAAVDQLIERLDSPRGRSVDEH